MHVGGGQRRIGAAGLARFVYPGTASHVASDGRDHLVLAPYPELIPAFYFLPLSTSSARSEAAA